MEKLEDKKKHTHTQKKKKKINKIDYKRWIGSLLYVVLTKKKN